MISAARPIRIGIVGLGHIGRYHVEALRRFDELRLVAACDLNPALRDLLPDGVRFYASDEELLGDPEIDTVIIATPNRTHCGLARKAHGRGRNVIMEKPAATNPADFGVLTRLFADGPQHLYYAFHAAKAFDVAWFAEHFAEPHERARLGPVTAFACHFYDPYVEDGAIKPEAVGLGNCWLDSGVNALSVLAEILDLQDLSAVSTTVARHASEGVPIQYLVQYQFAICGSGAGGIGTISTSWALDLNRKETWLGFGQSGHQVHLDHTRQRVVETGPARDSVVLRDFSATGDRLLNHYLGVFRDYLSCVRRGAFNGETAGRVHDQLFRATP